MKFPTLKIMIQYGIYTVKQLELFTKGLVGKRNIQPLSECEHCDFVFSGEQCGNCVP